MISTLVLVPKDRFFIPNCYFFNRFICVCAKGLRYCRLKRRESSRKRGKKSSSGPIQGEPEEGIKRRPDVLFPEKDKKQEDKPPVPGLTYVNVLFYQFRNFHRIVSDVLAKGTVFV